MLCVGQRVVERRQAIALRTDAPPWNGSRVPLEQRQRTQKVPGFTSPASANLEMLPVDVTMSVDGAGPDVGVVAGDDVPSAVTRQVHPLLDGASRAGRLDDDVGSLAIRCRPNRLEPFLGRCGVEMQGAVGAHLTCEI